MKMQITTKRILALLLAALGFVLGITWNPTGFCIGDKLFNILGLPVWSNGTSGTHYPAIVGTVAVLLGIAVFNSTLPEKAHKWVWLIVAAPFVIVPLLFIH